MVRTVTNFGQDPARALDYSYKAAWDQIFDYVIHQDESGDLVPGLATAWTASDDGLTWTFTIRDDVIFHNGDPLTPEDVKWSWEHLITNPESTHGLGAFADFVESISVSGNDVSIKTKEPDPSLPLLLSQLSGVIGGAVYNSKYIESVGLAEGFANPIGTGPFKFVAHEPEQSVTLTAFDDPNMGEWQRERTPGFKDITIRAVPDATTAVALLQTGEADLVPVPIASLGDVQAGGFKTVQVPNSTYSVAWCIGFTVTPESPCNDIKVREALNISIDSASIAQTVYQGTAKPTNAFPNGPGSFGYADDLAGHQYDAARAQQLLTEAGFTAASPLKVEILTYDDPADMPDMPTLAQAVAGYFDAVGIQSSIRPLEWGFMREGLYDQIFIGQPPNPSSDTINLFMRGMDNRYFFTGEILEQFTSAGRAGEVLWDNTKLPQQQEILDRLKGTFDLTEQESITKEFAKFSSEQYTYLPLLTADSTFGLSADIAAWSPIGGKAFPTNLWTLEPSN